MPHKSHHTEPKYIARESVTIRAPIAKVWEALITPELIKQYLFGTQAISDWKVGSPIMYTGVWEGKAYADKGTILKLIPEKILETTYWSGMSGVMDVPENYKKVTYELTTEQDGTILTVAQDNNATEAEKSHAQQNWKMVLTSLKQLLEKKTL